MPRSTIDAVGSNARCGSEVLTVNELSTTSVDEALRCVVAASAAAAQARDTSATSGNVSRHLLTGELLNWTPLLGGLSTLLDVLRPGEVGQRLRRGPFRLQPAGGSPAAAQPQKRRLLDRAAVERVRAPRVEAAARRRIRRVRHLPGQRAGEDAASVGRRHCGE